MNWETAVNRFNIRKMYKNISLENSTLLKPSMVEFGKKWCASPKKGSLFLTGTPGSGKTHFMICLLRALVEQGQEWLFFIKSGDLDRELLYAIQDKQEKFCLEKYQEARFLFIDDLGVEKHTDRMREQYYSLIDARVSDYLPTIYTSNLTIKEIGNALGERISSRLEDAYNVKFPNEDLRKKKELITYD
jgi:DNA replication protein DnaC